MVTRWWCGTMRLHSAPSAPSDWSQYSIQSSWRRPSKLQLRSNLSSQVFWREIYPTWMERGVRLCLFLWITWGSYVQRLQPRRKMHKSELVEICVNMFIENRHRKSGYENLEDSLLVVLYVQTCVFVGGPTKSARCTCPSKARNRWECRPCRIPRPCSSLPEPYALWLLCRATGTAPAPRRLRGRKGWASRRETRSDHSHENEPHQSNHPPPHSSRPGKTETTSQNYWGLSSWIQKESRSTPPKQSSKILGHTDHGSRSR